MEDRRFIGASRWIINPGIRYVPPLNAVVFF